MGRLQAFSLLLIAISCLVWMGESSETKGLYSVKLARYLDIAAAETTIQGEWNAALQGTSPNDFIAVSALGDAQISPFFSVFPTGGEPHGVFNISLAARSPNLVSQSYYPIGHFVVQYLYSNGSRFESIPLASSSLLLLQDPSPLYHLALELPPSSEEADSSFFRYFSAQKFACGSRVSLRWSSAASAPSPLKIGLFSPGNPAPLQAVPTTNRHSGTVEFVLPPTSAETLEFRLFSQENASSVPAFFAVSDLFETYCTNDTAISVHSTTTPGASNLSFVVGSSLTLTWSSPSFQAQDWIGIYPLGAVPGVTMDAITWQYVTSPSGSAGFLAPSLGGYYNIYYFPTGGYTSTLVSTIFLFQPDIQCISSGSISNSEITHVVLICTENHSWDSYFGAYCLAPTDSRPTCHSPPSSCCEVPPTLVSGSSPASLTDSQNLAWDPDHSYECEVCELNGTGTGGTMSGFVTGCYCSSPNNFAIGDPTTLAYYHTLANDYATGDNFFQPAAGASSENDMYLARAAFVFYDNTYVPPGPGSNCYGASSQKTYYDPNVAALLQSCGLKFGVHAGGYNRAVRDPQQNPCWPYGFDGSDIPFQYYFNTRLNYKDFDDFADDASRGELPNFSFLKPLGTSCEHPGVSTISAGEAFTKRTMDAIAASPLANHTLILLVPDESGGFFDHVGTPPNSPIDMMPYGSRIPIWALGYFAKSAYVSHTLMEHSSIVRFLEQNFLSGSPGQLGTRDAIVNSISDLLDPTKARLRF